MKSNPPECLLLCIRGDFFLCAQIDVRKARERELATLDEKSTNSGIACAVKIEGKNRGGRRDDTCDHGLSRGWKLDECEKIKK